MKYYGQVDEDMRASLNDDADYKLTYNTNVVSALQKMLKVFNFNYKKVRSPSKPCGRQPRISSSRNNIKRSSRKKLLGF